MTRMRTQYALIAVMAMLALFAGCKGESPTAPSNNPTTPPGGTVTPATGVTVTLAVSNSQPQVDSSSVITATVTQNGSPVPNGTAVEFTTNLGTFTEANAQTMIRTTTNGVATATLTSSTAGPATVIATVTNVSKTAVITFQLKPVVTPPPNTAPVITGISPTTGRPQGGEIVTITGSNFSAPKVIFDFGGGKTVEAQIVSQTPTAVQVLTPSVDLGTGQQKQATIVLINNAGTPNEVRVSAGTPFTFQAEVLTPKITAVSPASGPIDGGTRVTIFGEGFQAPVQVFFGAAEAQLAGPITFNQLVVIAPNASLTAANGSGAVLGPVAIKVININSATNVTAADAFRYVQKVIVTAAGPTVGPAEGGTRIQVDGSGFNDPLTVTTAGVAASIISANAGTRIIAITSPVLLTTCADITGPIIVTNIDNGDSATGPNFTYHVNKTSIVGISPSTVQAGGSLTVTLSGTAAGVNKILLGNQTAFVTNVTPNPDGTTSVTVTVPTNVQFVTQACTVGGVAGTQFAPTTVNVSVTNVTSTCSDTANNAVKITPPLPNPCVIPPPPSASIIPAGSTCADAGTASVGASATSTATITISNVGGQPLVISGAPISGANAGDFTISPTNASVPGGQAQTFTVTFKPTAVGARNATVTFSTNDPSNPSIAKCLQGTGTP